MCYDRGNEGHDMQEYMGIENVQGTVVLKLEACEVVTGSCIVFGTISENNSSLLA